MGVFRLICCLAVTNSYGLIFFRVRTLFESPVSARHPLLALRVGRVFPIRRAGQGIPCGRGGLVTSLSARRWLFSAAVGGGRRRNGVRLFFFLGFPERGQLGEGAQRRSAGESGLR